MNTLRDVTHEFAQTGMNPLTRVRSELESVFDRFIRDPFHGGWSQNGLMWTPAIDVTETDSEVTISAEVPGLLVKDIEVSISGNRLTLSGQKEESRESKGENHWLRERRFGAFRRVVELPEGIDPEKVTADHKHGVLTVHVAKDKSAKLKRVPVTGSR